MNSRKTYISYVIQKENGHTHYAEVVDLPMPETALYLNNIEVEVYRWIQKRNNSLLKSEQAIIQNYFIIE